MLTDISLEEAQDEIINKLLPMGTEIISILNALGRVSAVDMNAPCNLPVNNQSAVDGYALAALNDPGENQYLLMENVQFGAMPQQELQFGQAFGVVTGGNLPNGTIAVIPHEKAEIRNNILYPQEEVKTGNNIKQAGEDFAEGSLLMGKGKIIGAAEISLLAAFGIADIEVYLRPRVGILSLSKNVVPWQSSTDSGQMRDSNGPFLHALIIKDGGIPTVYITSDNDSYQDTIEKHSEQMDMLIMTGGTYAEGEKESCLLMQALGAELLYWDVDVQPGSHNGASLWDSRLIFALSGNPAACAVGYHLLVVPALRALQGLPAESKRVRAVCTNGLNKKTKTRRFVRGYLEWTEDGWQISVLPGQKPSMLRSLINCNALIDMPAGSRSIEAGEEVSVIVLDTLI